MKVTADQAYRAAPGNPQGMQSCGELQDLSVKGLVCDRMEDAFVILGQLDFMGTVAPCDLLQ